MTSHYQYFKSQKQIELHQSFEQIHGTDAAQYLTQLVSDYETSLQNFKTEYYPRVKQVRKPSKKQRKSDRKKLHSLKEWKEHPFRSAFRLAKLGLREVWKSFKRWYGA